MKIKSKVWFTAFFAITAITVFLMTACDDSPKSGGGGGGGSGTRTGGSGDPCTTHNWGWGTYTSGSGLRECRNSGCTEKAGVGDRGPAGGVIFIARAESITLLADSPLSDKQVHYYEAWTHNETETLQWGDRGTQISGISIGSPDGTSRIGHGLRETQRIVVNMANKEPTPITNTAAQRARVTGTGTTPGARGGFSDWFLPSVDELNELCKLWDSKGRGSYENLSTGTYWASSQVGLSEAWAVVFSTGYRGYTYKDNTNNVRAVRAF